MSSTLATSPEPPLENTTKKSPDPRAVTQVPDEVPRELIPVKDVAPSHRLLAPSRSVLLLLLTDVHPRANVTASARRRGSKAGTGNCGQRRDCRLALLGQGEDALLVLEVLVEASALRAALAVRALRKAWQRI